MQDPTTSRIKGVSVWFYVIAAMQLFSAYMMWTSGAGDPAIAQAAAVLAVVDIIIGALFVVFGYYGAKRKAWAFAAGLVLYALRSVLQFFEFFNPIVLLIRVFLLFRMFQGLQACLAANQADKLAAAMTTRCFEAPKAPVQAAAPVSAWTPPRTQTPQPSQADS